MSRKIKITEEVYQQCKMMVDAHIPQTQIAKILHIAPCSIARISKSESHEDYLTALRNRTQNQKEEKQEEKVSESKQTVVAQASHYMLEEQRKTNELLTVISNKLAAIVSDLYGVKE